ncbi:protease [Baekduia alba]|uniref:S8 family peptidase n=1 Tax=Baekduia alba TaxID=2997333 RepID=UPI002341583F|nr:S8 family peptidase [Baekduia alba]WCB91997.1 protease [Baekduia alba]
MPLLVPRALALLTTSTLAALALAPVAGASAAGIGAPDGLAGRPDHTVTRAAPLARTLGHGVKAHTAQAAASDPRAAEQWALDGDLPMGVETAWRQTTGADVTVAIVDSGIDLGHPDLVPNLWTNPGEIPGNGVDDDGNGYVDDVHGYDFVENDGTPQDGNGHGTHVAGIVAARGGNGIGTAGVAWRAKLMAVRVLDAAARGTTAGVASGIRYAVDNGARIVNLSLAGPSSTPDLEGAIQYAQARGVLVVVAAGNDGADLAAAPTYPAAYGEDNVLGVAATTRAGGLSSVSDYGPGADVAAPGEEILSTALGGGYEWRTGTSMAAPQVTGALVLLAAARPDLDANGLRNALLAGVRHSGLPVQDGAIDAGAALRTVIPAGAWKNPPAEALSTYAATAAPKSKAKKTSKAIKKKSKKLSAAARKKRAAAARKKAKARAHAKAKARAKAKAKARARSRRR